ncbi:hypothetical protein MMB75_25345 [Paenibacillus sp. P2(2022)]|uniref:BC1872 family protein n=1 Tax=Paenibacillus sp. P2(2022) TaxID=2917813 RepID=UPI0024069048|nr:hypothetical protein [Paenibacillus sp. P2(2022)]MDG0056954.1 hypothetical protein [Paenibacillus sp. P2(2022)]
MTRDEVIAKWNSMQPRERDAWVAEKVMGLELSDNMLAAYPKYRLPDYPDYFRDVPNYSTDISAAWEVIDKLSKTHFTEVAMTQLDDGSWGWMTRFILAEGEPYWVKGYRMAATTVQEAICLAALIAQGEGIEE